MLTEHLKSEFWPGFSFGRRLSDLIWSCINFNDRKKYLNISLPFEQNENCVQSGTEQDIWSP